MREHVRALVEHPYFERFVIGLIVFNAMILGMETSAALTTWAGGMLSAIDRIIVGIFVIELALRLIADPRAFIRDPWRWFDTGVVAISVVPATGALSVLRAFRVLRVLRLVANVPAMRRVVTGLLEALPGMGSIVLLLGLIFYVFAVICTKAFGAAFPEWFGTLAASGYTLFQIMTLESWSMGIVRPVMQEFPWAWALFLPFILATAFTVLNLFIGVIVDAMQSEHAAEAAAERESLTTDNGRILAELAEIRALLQKQRAD
ncbi:voltage-gated sodium channel [Monaibacterium marinum]|uniref:Voltage-gated sodium channel n=1 Tax=Pontivivens marinum TaxID=1690039 RepID=A0A2C9CRP0_9RHOB|nr:ion transporter [Monaibacterium marinum]SOH93878.1 voltage-gated sodium channel [Monaibacterium marinum]